MREEIDKLERGDYLMFFDPEYSLWFKCEVLKATENYYVVGDESWMWRC